MRCRVADHVYSLKLEREGQVARAAAQIKDASVGTPKNATEFLRRQPAPSVVHRERKEVVEHVISRRNSAEHIAHAAGGIALVASAFRTGPQTLRGRWFEDSHALSNSRGPVARRCQSSTSPGNARKLALVIRHGIAIPHFAFPMTEGSTQPISPE